ncbi:hypothetical protein HRG84_19125 [Flavisolibacter sp. BT320]|nr:hypothetical protein [Flavisolibacter longurius]
MISRKFLRCTICNKQIKKTLYGAHLRNAHHFTFKQSEQLADADIGFSNSTNETNHKVICFVCHSEVKRSKYASHLKVEHGIGNYSTKKRRYLITENAKSINSGSGTNLNSTTGNGDCSFHFITDDILFKNKSIEIGDRETEKKFDPILCKNSIEGLDKIKQEFFLRHHGKKLYKLTASGKKIILHLSPDVQSILNLVDEAIEYYHFRFDKTHKARFLSEKALQNLSNESILKIFGKNLDKEPYLEFLYSLHSDEYKLIPVLEFIGNKEEESFLFRIKGKKGSLLVVWENLNLARATYFFRIDPASSMLQEILNFIAEHEHGKRSFLRSPQNSWWATEVLGFMGFVEHNELDTYINEVHQITNC